MGGSQLTQGEPHIAYLWDNLHLKFLHMYWNCEVHWCQARSLWMLKCWSKFSPRSFSLNENMTQTCNPVLCLCCATGSSKSFPLEWTTWLYPFFSLMDNVAQTCNLMVVSVSTCRRPIYARAYTVMHAMHYVWGNPLSFGCHYLKHHILFFIKLEIA